MPIRITPLIDVVFILLVFFMLTSRLLPVSHMEFSNTTSNASPKAGDPLPEVIVQRGGKAHWQGESYTVGVLVSRLNADGAAEINLRAAPAARLTDFTQAFSRFSEGGITAHWKRGSEAEGQP